MDVYNNEVVSPRLYLPNVITAVTSNQVCHNSLFKKVPVNTDSRSSRVFVFNSKNTKKNPKSCASSCNRDHRALDPFQL